MPFWRDMLVPWRVYLFLGDEMKHLEQFSTSTLGRSYLFWDISSGLRKRSNFTFLISSSLWDLFQSLAFSLNIDPPRSKDLGFDFFVVPGWLSWKLSHLCIYCNPCRDLSHLYCVILINLQNISIVHTRSRWGTLNKIYWGDASKSLLSFTGTSSTSMIFHECFPVWIHFGQNRYFQS